MSLCGTIIRIPFWTTIKRYQSNREQSYMRGHRVPDRDTLGTQDDDCTMQRTQMPPPDAISLKHFEDCDSCNGRDGLNGCDDSVDVFYGYTRLWQPNVISTSHVPDEYGEQFGRSLGQHGVNTLRGHCVNTLGGHRVNTIRGARIDTLS
jgi:hypothetical protein